MKPLLINFIINCVLKIIKLTVDSCELPCTATDVSDTVETNLNNLSATQILVFNVILLLVQYKPRIRCQRSVALL